jgi:hypothetical protein
VRLLVVAATLLALTACDPNAGAYKPTAAAPALWDPRSPDVDPMDIASWRAAGIAMVDIPGWKVLGASPGEAAPLAAAGATPDQVQPFVEAGVPITDSATLSRAIMLRQAGNSIGKAVAYAKGGMGPTRAGAYEAGLRAQGAAEMQRQQTLAAQQQSAAAAEAQNQKRLQGIILAARAGPVLSAGDLAASSPFAVAGKCYRLRPVTVSQWIDASSAMVEDNSVRVDSDGTIPKTIIPEAIYIGEDSFAYTTVGGADRNIIRLKLLTDYALTSSRRSAASASALSSQPVNQATQGAHQGL